MTGVLILDVQEKVMQVIVRRERVKENYIELFHLSF